MPTQLETDDVLRPTACTVLQGKRASYMGTRALFKRRAFKITPDHIQMQVVARVLAPMLTYMHVRTPASSGLYILSLQEETRLLAVRPTQ